MYDASETVWTIWQRDEDTWVTAWAEPEGHVTLQVDNNSAPINCHLTPAKARLLAAELVRLAGMIERADAAHP